MDRLLPFDELNTLRPIVADIMQREDREQFYEYLYDEIEDILILSYMFGNEAANTDLGESVKIDRDELEESVFKVIAGEKWPERIKKHLENGTAEEIMRVAETEAHRIYNEAIFSVALTVDYPVWKTWECMMLPTSRDTHIYLEGQKQLLNAPFFTFDGDFAMHPGDFLLPENNVNCLCRIRLTKEPF